MGMTVEGFDRFTASLDKLTALPDATVAEMLTAGGEVIKEGKPNVKAGYVEIRPTGTRKSGRKTVRNEEIGYITEYGKKGEPARPWMREGNADSEDKAVDFAGQVFDNYLDKIGL